MTTLFIGFAVPAVEVAKAMKTTTSKLTAECVELAIVIGER
jgi:hypothetical protein